MTEKTVSLTRFLPARKANIARDVGKQQLTPVQSVKKRKLEEDASLPAPAHKLLLSVFGEPGGAHQIRRSPRGHQTTPGRVAATTPCRSARTQVISGEPTPPSTKRARGAPPTIRSKSQPQLQFAPVTTPVNPPPHPKDASPTVPACITQPLPSPAPQVPATALPAPVQEPVAPPSAPDSLQPTPLAARQIETEAIREAHRCLRYGIAPQSPTALVPSPADSGPTIDVSPITTPLALAPPASEGELPGFQKFQHLRSNPASAAHTISLGLPSELQRLDMLFQSIEHTLVFMKGQNQPCIYHRIRKPVENMCRRNFELEHLGQIMTLCPEIYHLNAVRHLHQGARIPSVEIQWGPHFDGVLTGGQLEARRSQFKDALLNYTFQAHNRFLENDLGMSPVASIQVLDQWHADFKLDTQVSAVPSATLPRLELHTVSQQRVQDLLAKLKGRHPSRVGIVAASAPGSAAAIAPLASDESAAPKPPASKPLSLLERIRQKEQNRKRDTMLGITPENVTHRAMLSRLPDMVDTLSFLFYAAKRTIMKMKELAPKLVDSHKLPLSESEAVQHISLLSTTVPTWCKLTIIGIETMVKVDRAVSVRSAKDTIQAKLLEATA
ncbi:hypothetical protein H4R33_003028 [Dimargaris cristalligena]|nr:hypothetical protein H4R33_003028 [Dimargaris cristalligena]